MPYTPGPWKIIYGGFRHDDGFAIGTDNAAASRVKVVAECWPCVIIDQEHRDELLANAKLIAAAPAALALLKGLRQNCDPTRCSMDRDVCNCDMCAIDRFLKSVE